jgi:hypothetical protein
MKNSIVFPLRFSFGASAWRLVVKDAGFGHRRGMLQSKEAGWASRLGSPPAVGVAQLPNGHVRLLGQLEVGGSHRSAHGVDWIKQPHVTEFLQKLAVTPSITHEALDELPRSRTRDYVRGLLVEHGALPAVTSSGSATTNGRQMH